MVFSLSDEKPKIKAYVTRETNGENWLPLAAFDNIQKILAFISLHQTAIDQF